jgi:hypothetical protein
MTGMLAGIATSVATWLLFLRWPCSPVDALHALAGGYASTAGTMLGFVLTMLTVFLSLSDRRLIRNMARTGHFLRMMRGMYICAAYFGSALIIALPLLVLDGQALHLGITISTGLLASAAIQLISSGRKMWQVLMLVSSAITGPLE